MNVYAVKPKLNGRFSEKLIAIFSFKSLLLQLILASTLWLVSAAAAAQSVTVVEYYNRALDAYFMTGRSVEQTLLDGLPADFSRTGMEFSATAATSATASQVRICRFYVNPVTPFTNSHFYGREGTDCEALRAQNLAGFNYEDFDFAVAQPDASGACAASTPLPVFRSFRPGVSGTAGSAARTSNHRYSTRLASYNALTAASWTPELAVFCVASSKDSAAPAQSSFKRVVSLPLTPFAPGCNGQFSGNNGINYSGAEVEPSLARNPANPDHLVAAWQQDRWSNGGAQGAAGAVSFDGGRSWANTRAAFSLCSGGSNANGGGYNRASDPWVTINAEGTAFQMVLAFSGESFAANSVNAMLVSRSTDGGRTWAPAQTLARDTGAAVFHDKNMIVADPNNAAFVYAIWGRLDNNGNGHGPAWFTRSTNSGLSWEQGRAAYDPGADNQTSGNQIVVLANGNLVNVFLDIIRTATSDSEVGNRMRVIRSNDRGVSWSTPSTISQFASVGTFDPTTRDRVRDGSIVASIAAGVDGRLHVVWQDARFNNGVHDSIAYSQSSDGGLSWTTPVAINARTDVAAFTPNVTVRADGTIGVSYYDFRRDTGDRTTLPTVYRLATSKDGLNWRESGIEDSFELRQAPIAGGYFLGDYQALVSNGSAFSALYARTGGAVNNNATEIVFANVAEGTLKRAADGAAAASAGGYAARQLPADFAIDTHFADRVRANVERNLAIRRAKFLQP